MIAIDSETTGLDWNHGALPFFISTCDSNDEQLNWCFDVDPYTRRPTISKGDIEEIKHIVETAKNWGERNYSKDIADRHCLLLHNSKFDVTMLGCVDPWFRENWPWKQTRDTIIAGHLLDSGNPHNLRDMASQYLSLNIKPYEDKLEKAVQKARRIARRKFPEWMIAEEGLECMPSQKSSGKDKEDKAWYADMWLLKALINEMGYDRITSELDDRDHKWDTLVADYCNADTYATFHLWQVMEKKLHERDLWEIFECRMKLPPIALKMEHKGITLSKTRLDELEAEYAREVDKAETICVNIASSYLDDEGEPIELKLPKSGNNKQLTDLVFNRMKLPTLKETKTGNASLDKDVIEEYLEQLPPKTPELLFMQNLSATRKRTKALDNMSTYKRYWIEVNGKPGFHTLHSNLNITGTAHLRWSCDNPNTQNVSKKEGFNLRYLFGPAPGREWWAMDAQNIELRLPAFESGEKDLMHVFLHPEEAPYFGSYHLVVFDALHPKLFAEYGVKCKEEFESTWYQWVKNFNFALIYGCQEKKGDATAHVPGAFKKIRHRFPKIAQLSDRMIAMANKTGGIETIPDKDINPRRGYPIKCSFGNWGKVRPTLPLNYHTSGSAMHWMGKGMIRTEEQLEEYRASNFDGHMIMQVHDELVFDFPKSGKSPIEQSKRIKAGEKLDIFNDILSCNLWRAKQLRDLMQKGGDDYGIPTPVSIKYIEYTLDKGVAV